MEVLVPRKQPPSCATYRMCPYSMCPCLSICVARVSVCVGVPCTHPGQRPQERSYVSTYLQRPLP